MDATNLFIGSITASQDTLPETNSKASHLKMHGWNTFSFPFGAFRLIFRGELAVSFRECKD